MGIDRLRAALVVAAATLVVGCSLGAGPNIGPAAVRSTVTAPPAATTSPTMVVAGIELTPAAAVSTPQPLQVTPTPTETARPSASPTPSPDLSVDVDLPLLIDSANGRIFAAATTRVGRQKRTVVLSASDGRQLAIYDLPGGLAIDVEHGWLYADQGDDGIAFADATSGVIRRRVALPPLPADIAYLRVPAPQADPVAGVVLAARDNTIYIVNGASGIVERSIPFSLPQQSNDCRAARAGGQPITATWYDAPRRILYVSYISIQCPSYIGYAIVSYDITAGKEIARSGADELTAVATGGYLYGTSSNRVGNVSTFAWRDGKPWRQIQDSIMSSGMQVDTKRGRLYQSAGADLRIFAADTLNLLVVVPQLLPGLLAGFDPASDNLYFLTDGQVHAYPAASIVPSRSPVLQPVRVYQAPLIALSVSPNWSQDKTIAAIWKEDGTRRACGIWAAEGGQMLLSTDGAQSWVQPLAGLPTQCNRVTALAISPDYAHDKAIFAGAAGGGLFRTTDGGFSWLPASNGLLSMGVRTVLVSPGFARDRTIVVHTGYDKMAISSDGGETWRDAGTGTSLIALSPDYEQDRTIVKHLVWADRVELKLSRDGGVNWASLTNLPRWLDMISIAPVFAKNGVVFAQNDQGILYRSANSGKTWTDVLTTTGVAQMVYGSTGANQPIFLVSSKDDLKASPPLWTGALHRSLDGGLTWHELALPGDAVPTALAISPDFEHDRSIFVGTASGELEPVMHFAP